MSKGYVYILTNESMPGLVKIGMTRRTPEQRAKELSDATGVPRPFTVHSQFYSPDCQSLEACIHAELADCRVNAGREFFECSAWAAEQICAAAHMVMIKEFVGEFAPLHILCDETLCVDEADTLMAAKNLEVDPQDIANILLNLTKAEAQPAIDRLNAKVSARRARMAAGMPAFDGTERTRIREQHD